MILTDIISHLTERCIKKSRVVYIFCALIIHNTNIITQSLKDETQVYTNLQCSKQCS